jgi:hypothetical protein
MAGDMHGDMKLSDDGNSDDGDAGDKGEVVGKRWLW